MVNNLSDGEIKKLRQLLRTIPCNGLDTYVAGTGIQINDTNCCHVKELVNTGVPGPEGPQGEKGDPGDITNLYYGSFYDTTTQSVASEEIVAMKLNSTDSVCTNGFSITNNALGQPTRITAQNAGIYDLQFSAQLNRTSGGSSEQTDIWIRINETDVPNSATGITMQANDGKIVAAWNFFVALDAGEYVELMWTQTDNIQILYSTSNAVVPVATPSVIATISKIGEYVQVA